MHMRMKAITIRNLPPEVQRAVKEKARKEGLSVNRAVGALLEVATGRTPKRRARHHDFDKYAGRWRKAEADAFDASLREQRGVDPDDWK
jgi:antitoxin FitA-like protein